MKKILIGLLLVSSQLFATKSAAEIKKAAKAIQKEMDEQLPPLAEKALPDIVRLNEFVRKLQFETNKEDRYKRSALEDFHRTLRNRIDNRTLMHDAVFTRPIDSLVSLSDERIRLGIQLQEKNLESIAFYEKLAKKSPRTCSMDSTVVAAFSKYIRYFGDEKEMKEIVETYSRLKENMSNFSNTYHKLVGKMRKVLDVDFTGLKGMRGYIKSKKGNKYVSSKTKTNILGQKYTDEEWHITIPPKYKKYYVDGNYLQGSGKCTEKERKNEINGIKSVYYCKVSPKFVKQIDLLGKYQHLWDELLALSKKSNNSTELVWNYYQDKNKKPYYSDWKGANKGEVAKLKAEATAIHAEAIKTQWVEIKMKVVYRDENSQTQNYSSTDSALLKTKDGKVVKVIKGLDKGYVYLNGVPKGEYQVCKDDKCKDIKADQCENNLYSVYIEDQYKLKREKDRQAKEEEKKAAAAKRKASSSSSKPSTSSSSNSVGGATKKAKSTVNKLKSLW